MVRHALLGMFLSALVLLSGFGTSAAQDTVPLIVVACNCDRADVANNVFDKLANYIQVNHVTNADIVMAGNDGSTSSWHVDQYGVPTPKGSPTPPHGGSTGGGGGGGGSGGGGGYNPPGGCYGSSCYDFDCKVGGRPCSELPTAAPPVREEQ